MISVVVPNFNCGERLAKNLPRLLELLKKSKLEYEVIVVDDASTDDSIRLIKTTFARGGLANGSDIVQILRNDKNRGFGMTVDRGIREAKGEIVFVLNVNDLLPESPEYFRLMLRHFSGYSDDSDDQMIRRSDKSGGQKFRQTGNYERVFSVGALKRDEEDHGCGEIYFEKGFFLHRKSNRKYTNQEQIYKSAWSDGGAQALRKEYYLKIGGFDPLYKFYWEDVDLGYRAWKAGYRIDFEPKAILLHQKEEGPIAKFYTEKQQRVMNLRNQMIFTWKNADAKHLMYHVSRIMYHVLIAIKNGDGDWFKALFQAKLQVFNILAARFWQRNVTKLSDDQVLRVFQEKSL